MKNVDLTEGHILKVVMTLALPIIGTSLLQFTYNLVDMFWVGRLGSDALASVGASSLFVNSGYAINSLVVIGTGIRASHAIGKKDRKEATQYINAGLIMNCVLAVLYGGVLLIFGRAFIDFLNLKSAAIEQDAYIYLITYVPVLFFSFFNMLYTRILSSFGNNKISFVISLIGTVLNIVLDPLFIYTLGMGVFGAAASTLIATLVMFILFNVVFKDTLRYSKQEKLDYHKIKDIIKLGAPMAAQRLLFSVIGIILAKVVAKFGSDAIAAQKIGLQIESITYMVIGGLNGAIASFVGQNYGAKKFERIHKGYKSALVVGTGYSFVMAIFFLGIPQILAGVFVNDYNTINIAASYLRVVGIVQIFSTVEMISNGTFTGLGLPKIPAFISILFTSARIPFALVFTHFWGIDGVWISIAISSLLKGCISFLVYYFIVRKEHKSAGYI